MENHHQSRMRITNGKRENCPPRSGLVQLWADVAALLKVELGKVP